MTLVGLDDTDTIDHPGTNQLARHIVAKLADRYCGRRIVRHQLLMDPHVPYTKKNGCASICFDDIPAEDVADFASRLRELILPWCPVGSDPGLCIAQGISEEVAAFGQRCQQEVVTQAEARALAAGQGLYLQGLGGTQDGVIGALAAVGLAKSGQDGRVIYLCANGHDLYEVSGSQPVSVILQAGIDEIRPIEPGPLVLSGSVDVGKRLRPNLRNGRIVLFVQPSTTGEVEWEAVRVP